MKIPRWLWYFSYRCSQPHLTTYELRGIIAWLRWMPSSSKARFPPCTRFVCFICFPELPFFTHPLSQHSSKRVQLTHSLPSPQPSTSHNPASWKWWMIILRLPTFYLPSNSLIRSLKYNINASPFTQSLSGFSCYQSLLVIPFPSLPRYCELNAPLKHTQVDPQPDSVSRGDLSGMAMPWGYSY